jgi:hypothetical protein
MATVGSGYAEANLAGSLMCLISAATRASLTPGRSSGAKPHGVCTLTNASPPPAPSLVASLLLLLLWPVATSRRGFLCQVRHIHTYIYIIHTYSVYLTGSHRETPAHSSRTGPPRPTCASGLPRSSGWPGAPSTLGLLRDITFPIRIIEYI